ncbi:hypothetical protein ACIOWI_34470 [Streptomyces sp. NPDC087659]|uniref:hypothetical protein n=1 Tax=Streptomyces sp. NPDC087659 TaxID=3365801 RepID=UPI0037F46344
MSRKNNPQAVRRPGKLRALWHAVVGLARMVWSVVRFYGGRELQGEPRSTATFLRPGKPVQGFGPVAPAVSMASIAVAPPKVSLVKAPRRAPRPWARATAAWIETYSGKGAGALDRAVRAVLWCASLAGKIWQGLKAVYGVVAPIVATIARVVGMWHCWPYAARGLARVAMTAALLGFLVPAWRTRIIVLLVLALAAVVAAAHRFQPKPPGDDAVYGPKIWPILSHDLGLPEDEPRESWLWLPELLAADDARIVVRLPWDFRGSEAEKDNVTALINSRVPGEWVGRFIFTGEHAKAVYTHKPPPKPKEPEPECPERVGFFDPDIQEAIANCKKGEIVVGKDPFGRIIIKKLDGETPHWALSVGTGGGKSAFCHMVIAQLIRQGYHIMAADVKRVSVDIYIGVPGVYVYNDPMNPQDMRAGIEWAVEEISARSAIAEADKSAEFPGLLILIEEANEFADVSREWWDENRKSKDDEFGAKDRAADSIWGTVASGARLGRHVHGNILAIFQDLRDQALGGKGLRNLFRLKLMGNFTVNSWKNVIGTTPVPESVDKAGRMMVVEGNSQYWVQTCFAEPEELRDWAIEQREAIGFDPAAGLWGTAPKPSPKRLPRLLQGVSRDKLPEGLRGASEGGLSGENAGHGVTLDLGVTPGVTPQRDGLRLIPGQAGAEGAEDPLKAPVLLSIAEIAREMQARRYDIEAELIRKHKSRRESTGFPVGIGEGREEKFTLTQLITFYEQRGIGKREESEEEAQQGDAV